jgi:hypothetical protein
MINLLEHYDLGNQTDVPPLKLLLIPHARAWHESQCKAKNQLLVEQRDAERERRQAEAAAKCAPLEAARDAEIAKVMEAARIKCAKITAKYKAQIDPMRAELQRELDTDYAKCFHATERNAEPMETAVNDAWTDGQRAGWKQCRYYYEHEDGSKPGCRVWFRPEDEEADCDNFGTLEEACDGFEGCDRHLTICRNCRCTAYDTMPCEICDGCYCDGGHEEGNCDPEYFCEQHFELHVKYCLRAHSNLCGYSCDEGKMMPGYCRRAVAAGDEAECSGECGINMCRGCAWQCDGVEADDGWGGGGTRECCRRYCKQCLPASLKAELADSSAEAEGHGGSSRPAQYCGHCIGDGCEYEEQQERKRMRRYAFDSLARGEYVHPSHYMDEDTYHERFS